MCSSAVLLYLTTQLCENLEAYFRIAFVPVRPAWSRPGGCTRGCTRTTRRAFSIAEPAKMPTEWRGWCPISADRRQMWQDIGDTKWKGSPHGQGAVPRRGAPARGTQRCRARAISRRPPELAVQALGAAPR